MAAPAPVGGAGAAAAAPVQQGSFTSRLMQWVSGVAGQVCIYANMAIERARAPPTRPTIEEIGERASGSKYNPAGIFFSISPSMPGYSAALSAAEAAHKATVDLLNSFLQYKAVYDANSSADRNDPELAIYTIVLLEKILIYNILAYEKYKLRAPLVLGAARAGEIPKRSASGAVNVKGKPLILMPYELADALNAFIDMNTDLARTYFIERGQGAGISATPPTLFGLPDPENYNDWANSRALDAAKAKAYEVVGLAIEAKAALAITAKSDSKVDKRYTLVLDRLVDNLSRVPPKGVCTASGGGAGAAAAPLVLRNFAAPAASAINLFAAPSGGGGGGGGAGSAASALAAVTAAVGDASSISDVGAKRKRSKNSAAATATSNTNGNAGAAAAAPNAASAPPAAKKPRGPEPNSNQEGGARRSRRHRKTRRRIHKHKSRKANKTQRRSRQH